MYCTCLIVCVTEFVIVYFGVTVCLHPEWCQPCTTYTLFLSPHPTHTRVVLYQLSYEANWELVTLSS